MHYGKLRHPHCTVIKLFIFMSNTCTVRYQDTNLSPIPRYTVFFIGYMISLIASVQDASVLEPLEDGLNALLNIEVSKILGFMPVICLCGFLLFLYLAKMVVFL